jgi:hypothetical protein
VLLFLLVEQECLFLEQVLVVAFLHQVRWAEQSDWLVVQEE